VVSRDDGAETRLIEELIGHNRSASIILQSRACVEDQHGFGEDNFEVLAPPLRSNWSDSSKWSSDIWLQARSAVARLVSLPRITLKRRLIAPLNSYGIRVHCGVPFHSQDARAARF